jgi:hypothetical protein
VKVEERRELVVGQLGAAVVGCFHRVLDVGRRVTFLGDGIFRRCLA